MVRKLLIYIGLVLVALLLWLLLTQDQPEKLVDEAVNSTPIEASEQRTMTEALPEFQPEPQLEPQSVLDYLPPMIEVEADDYDLLMAETASQIYSDDPYVEGFSLHLRATECDLLDANFMTYQLGQSEAGTQVLQDKQQQCQQWKTQFPMLSAKAMWSQKSAELPASSQLAQLIKQYAKLTNPIDRINLSADLFEQGLSEKNPYVLNYILTHAAYVGDQFTTENNQNSTYAELVFRTAADLLSCEFNQAEFCSASSWLMINKCSSNASYCGMTYQQWFEKNFMPGMKQDVATVLNQLKARAKR